MSDHDKPAWKVQAWDWPGSELAKECADIDKVLDYCGRLFYGQTVIKIIFVEIFQEHAEGKTQGWDDSERDDESFQWIMKPIRRGEPRTARYFHHTHDLYGMLIAELRQGSDRIEISREL